MRCSVRCVAVSCKDDACNGSYTYVTMFAVDKRPVHSYVWHDSFICVTWLIHLFERDSFECSQHPVHLHVWLDAFMLVIWIWLFHMYDMTHPYAWHDVFICETLLIRYLRPDSFIRVIWTHLYVWRDSFIHAKWRFSLDLFKYVIWLIHVYDLTHSYVRHDLLTHRCVNCLLTWLLHVYDLTYHVQMCQRPSGHDLTCRTWLIHTYDLTCGTWLIYTCDLTHAYVWHDPSRADVSVAFWQRTSFEDTPTDKSKCVGVFPGGSVEGGGDVQGFLLPRAWWKPTYGILICCSALQYVLQWFSVICTVLITCAKVVVPFCVHEHLHLSTARAYVRVRACVWMCMYLYLHACIYIYGWVDIYTNVCIHIYMHIHTYVCTPVWCMYLYIIQ